MSYRKSTLRYLILVLSAIISVIATSVFLEFKRRNLTYKAWIPFDHSNFAVYFLVYSYQLVGMATSGIVNVACESVISGLLLHICCQFEILEYRLTKLTHGENILPDCIRHHNLIFELVLLTQVCHSKAVDCMENNTLSNLINCFIWLTSTAQDWFLLFWIYLFKFVFYIFFLSLYIFYI